MKDPLISIIVPVFNAEKYLKRCIDSVLSQTYQNFELILVNDGSSDSSKDICEEYTKRDNRIKLFNKKNGGVSSARNLGLDNASGEWVSFVDADDMLYSQALTNMIRAVDSSGADVVLVNVDEETSKGIKKKFTNFQSYTTDIPFSLVKNRAIWGYLFSTKLIEVERIRFNTDLAYSEDTVFLYFVLNKASRLVVIDESLYLYNRLNENSACSSLDGMRKVKHQINAAKELKNLQNSLREEHKTSILNREIQKILLMGFLSYHQGGDYKDYRNLFSFFKEKMGVGLKYKLLFYKLYTKTYLLTQRRRILKLRNS